MTCDKSKRQLADYAVGVLRARPAEALERHLAGCDACRQELRALQAVETLLAGAPKFEPPVGLWRGIAGELTARRDPWWRGAWQTLTATPRRQFATVAVTAVVVLAVVLSAWLLPGRGPAGPYLVEQPEAEGEAYAAYYAATSWGGPLADEAALGFVLASLPIETEEDATP